MKPLPTDLRSILIAGLMALLVGCGTGPTKEPLVKQETIFVEFHRRAAIEAQQSGHIQQALQHWRILAVVHNNADIHQRIRQLEKQAQSQSRKLQGEALALLKSKKYKDARTKLLQALQSDPGNSEASKQLRELFKAQIEREQAFKNRQTAKRNGSAGKPANTEVIAMKVDKSNLSHETHSHDSEKREVRVASVASLDPNHGDTVVAALRQEKVAPAKMPNGLQLGHFQRLHQQGSYRQLIKEFKASSWTGSVPEVLKVWLTDAFLHQHQQLVDAGRYRQALSMLSGEKSYDDQAGRLQMAEDRAKKQLAREFYSKGKALFKRDIEGAILLWERGLDYDPTAAEMRFQLQKAYRIRDNLKRIDKGDK